MKELKLPKSYGSIYHGDDYIGETDWSDVSGRPLPEPKITANNIAEIKQRFEQAGIGDQSEKAIEIFKRITTDYMVEIQREDTGVDLDDINKFVRKLNYEIERVRAVLKPKNETETLIIRNLCLIATEGLHDAMSVAIKRAEKLQAKAQEYKNSGFKEMQAKRRRQFADVFYQTFKDNGWSLKTSAKSLMGMSFSICLSAAGDVGQKNVGIPGEVAKIGQLLGNAAK